MAKAKEADTEILDLTEKQKKFCEEFVMDWNGTRSAITAGYAEVGAHVEANRLLKNAKIIQYVNELRDKTEELAGVSKLMATTELKTIIKSDSESTKNKITAMDSLAKLLGWNAAQKKELTGKDGIPLQITGMVIVNE